MEPALAPSESASGNKPGMSSEGVGLRGGESDHDGATAIAAASGDGGRPVAAALPPSLLLPPLLMLRDRRAAIITCFASKPSVASSETPLDSGDGGWLDDGNVDAEVATAFEIEIEAEAEVAKAKAAEKASEMKKEAEKIEQAAEKMKKAGEKMEKAGEKEMKQKTEKEKGSEIARSKKETLRYNRMGC